MQNRMQTQAFFTNIVSKENVPTTQNYTSKQNTQAFDRKSSIILFPKLGLHKKERFWQLQISHLSKAQARLLRMDCTEIRLLLKDRELKEHSIMQRLWQAS